MPAFLLLMAAASAIPVPDRSEASRPACRSRTTPASGAAAAAIGPLNRQPRADLFLAVLRLRDGCEVPVLVRRDIGQPPASTTAPR